MKNKKIRYKISRLYLSFALVLLVAGCGAKVDEMQAGLMKSGMSAEQAACMAEAMKSMDSEPYNYMADLLNAGVDEGTAINKTRRKFGAEFKEVLEKARETCAD